MTLTFNPWPWKSIGVVVFFSQEVCVQSLTILAGTGQSVLFTSFLDRRPDKRTPVPYHNKHINIVVAFRGMHVSPAKHSYAWLPKVWLPKVWLPKCDYQNMTTRQTPDKVIPMCCCASQATQKINDIAYNIITKYIDNALDGKAKKLIYPYRRVFRDVVPVTYLTLILIFPWYSMHIACQSKKSLLHN